MLADQTNDDERAQSILLMDKIFDGPPPVIIWLGDAPVLGRKLGDVHLDRAMASRNSNEACFYETGLCYTDYLRNKIERPTICKQ